ncbi:hypothetical protein FFLO_04417 [Filobasidium floriforme]|uniref:Zn(2)-C6 fungal-type domain-containing protein n=1 Tax=Filobasidium floriforme TaxID=5210 RepID=A0A8K0JPB5_9TREE|nr:uncharacterized protein HD553DRAFT_152457 [Filobasidium floriforme]KAG7531356.1 hypothetical protein FFLO_04417 [Filobasidium floriforme]KAH8078005.1 hypothetical protein HD553DRAFT_152457 [Filobasidium floriforme]
MSTLPRACTRCIGRKRKCDFVRPKCANCDRIDSTCIYPSPQKRRGPLGGFSRLAEDRTIACEDALFFMLAQPAIRACLSLLRDEVDAIPQAVDKTLSKEARTAWWSDHPVDTISALLSLPIGTEGVSASQGRVGSAVDVEANSSSELEVNQDERERSSTEQMKGMPGELDPGPKRTIVGRFSALHRPE